MKKVKVLVPLIAALAVLASCGGGTSSSAESSSVTGTSSETPVESSLIDGSSVTGESTDGESSEEPEEPEEPVSELAAALEELSIGYDIDISVNETYFGSIALNDEGATVEIPVYDQVYYFAPETIDGVDYVGYAELNLANEVETEVVEEGATWASYFTNVWSVLSEEDFDQLSTGYYSAYIDADDDVAFYAAFQLSLANAMASDVDEINLTMEEGEVVQIELVAGNDSITATVNALGDAVEAGLKPYAGESIEAIDTIVSSIQEGNYTLTEQWAYDDDEGGNYVVDDAYTSNLYVSDGLAYDDSGYAYQPYDEGVYELVGPTSSGYWYVNYDCYGYAWEDIVAGCRISSQLLEANGDGTYSLIDNVPGLVPEISAYDPYSSGTIDNLTVSLGEGTITLTTELSASAEIIVTYSAIGTTTLPSTLSEENIHLLTMAGYYNWYLSYADAGYDLATSLGTSDTDLWYAAFSEIDIPYYDFYGASLYSAGLDAFITEDDYDETSLTPCICYDYYDITNSSYCYGWYFFENYLVNHGFEESVLDGLDGYEYSVYTAEFEYSGETHTVTVVEGGLGYSNDKTYYELLFYVKIDLNLSAFSSSAAE